MASSMNEPPNSRFARIWGTGNPHRPRHLTGTGRSGLTPTRELQGEVSHDLRALEITYQRLRAIGFSTSDLHVVGALAESEPDIKETTLDNPIHPVFDRENWSRFSSDRLPGFGDGTWTAHREEVWSILVPILRLATKFLTLSDFYPFFLALTQSSLYAMSEYPSGRAAAGRLLPLVTSTVLGRQRPLFPNPNLSTERNINQFAGVIHFRIGTGYNELTSLTQFSQGYYVRLGGNRHPVTLALEDLHALLNPNISISQKLMLQFSLAVTIVHEICHAICGIRFASPSVYFNDEGIYEIGASFENAMFGGRVMTMPNKVRNTEADSSGYFAMALSDWPSFYDVDNLSEEEKDDIHDLRDFGGQAVIRRDVYPISMQWISDIQSKEYWDVHVARYQCQSLKPYPQILGIRWTKVRQFDGKFPVHPSASFTRGQDLHKYDYLMEDQHQDPELLSGQFVGKARAIEMSRVIKARGVARRLRGINFYNEVLRRTVAFAGFDELCTSFREL